VSPSVGDSYGLLVTYSDGTSETLTATVAAVLNSFATNLAPTTGTSQSTTPTFSWTDAANASGYLYSFDLYSTTGGPIWQIPSNNSNFTGFPSSITSITWGTDPTGDTSNLPSVSSLTDGTTYDWVITAYDSNFDSASIQVSYEPGSTPADLPAPKPVPRVKR
jgi:hypothetical protein